MPNYDAFFEANRQAATASSTGLSQGLSTGLQLGNIISQKRQQRNINQLERAKIDEQIRQFNVEQKSLKIQNEIELANESLKLSADPQISEELALSHYNTAMQHFHNARITGGRTDVSSFKPVTRKQFTPGRKERAELSKKLSATANRYDITTIEGQMGYEAEEYRLIQDTNAKLREQGKPVANTGVFSPDAQVKRLESMKTRAMHLRDTRFKQLQPGSQMFNVDEGVLAGIQVPFKQTTASGVGSPSMEQLRQNVTEGLETGEISQGEAIEMMGKINAADPKVLAAKAGITREEVKQTGGITREEIKQQGGLAKEEVKAGVKLDVTKLRESGLNNRLRSELRSKGEIVGAGFDNKLKLATISQETEIEKARIAMESNIETAKISHRAKTLNESITRDFADGKLDFSEALTRSTKINTINPRILAAQVQAISDLNLAKSKNTSALALEKIRQDGQLKIEGIKNIINREKLTSAENIAIINADSAENIADINSNAKIKSSRLAQEAKTEMDRADTDLKRANVISTIQGKFERDPRVATYRTIDFKVKQAHRVYQKALREGVKSLNANDQVIINAFMKITDETSVVRESEFDRAAEFMSLSNRIRGLFSRWKKGGNLTPEERTNFINTMVTIRNISKEMFTDASRQYIDISREGGINPSLIVGDAYEEKQDLSNASSDELRKMLQ